MTEKAEQRPLNEKQQKFVKHYVACGNATAAARLAGYTGDYLDRAAHNRLRKPHVRAAIDKLRGEVVQNTSFDLIDVQEELYRLAHDPDTPAGTRVTCLATLAKSMGVEKVEHSGVQAINITRTVHAASRKTDDEG